MFVQALTSYPNRASINSSLKGIFFISVYQPETNSCGTTINEVLGHLCVLKIKGRRAGFREFVSNKIFSTIRLPG